MILTRKERIKLLLKTRIDAQNEGSASDGVRVKGKLSGRGLRYGDLYEEGSYAQLEHCLDRLKERSRGVHWHVLELYCKGNPDGKARAKKAELGVAWLMKAMPACVYVPFDVSENAGFIESEAKKYRKPRRELAA